VLSSCLPCCAIDFFDDVADRTPMRSAGPPFMGLMIAMPRHAAGLMAPMPKKEPFCSSRNNLNSLRPCSSSGIQACAHALDGGVGELPGRGGSWCPSGPGP